MQGAGNRALYAQPLEKVVSNMSVNMLFVCDNNGCETVDSLRATVQQGGGYQCHRCLNGYWHDMFPEEKYDPNVTVAINRHNPYFNDHGEPSFGN